MNLREMDRKIAEKVMGWTLLNYEDDEREACCAADYIDASNNDGWHWDGRDDSTEAWEWTPTTDPACSQMLRAKLAEKWPIWQLTRKLGGLIVFEMWPIGGQWYHGEAETEELAVALCACRAFGIEVAE